TCVLRSRRYATALTDGRPQRYGEPGDDDPERVRDKNTGVFSNGHSPRVPNTVHLPEELGFVPCLRHVRQQQACAQAALRVQAPCDPAIAYRASRGACVRCLDYGTFLHTASTQAPALNERNELALGLGIPLDVALGHGETGMAGELLDVPETPPDLRDFACGAGNERPAAGMRRTAVH